MRVLYVNSVLLVWTVILSYIKHKVGEIGVLRLVVNHIS